MPDVVLVMKQKDPEKKKKKKRKSRKNKTVFQEVQGDEGMMILKIVIDRGE